MEGGSSRRTLLALLGAVAVPGAWAQPQETGRLRLIVPAPAGGTTDMVARALGEALRRDMGIVVVVDNRPGAGGAVATAAFLNSVPDGTTLLLSPNSLVTEVPYTIRPAYDPFNDLVPVVEVASSGLVLVAHAGLPVGNLEELIGYVKARPGQVAFASYGAGTISHIKGLQLNKAAGLDMRHIGYKGSPPALQDVIGGEVPFMFDGIATSVPHVTASRLKAIAVTSAERSAVLPHVPTLAELGFGGLTQTIALTVFAMRGVPTVTLARLRAGILAALRTEAVEFAFHAAGLEIAPQDQSTDALRRSLRREYEQTGEILHAIGYVPRP